jgi:hypothetical protein
MEIDCAGCGRPMKAVLGACGHCRRPNDESEIENGLAAARERRGRPLRFVVWAAVFLSAAAGLYACRNALKQGAAALVQDATALQQLAKEQPAQLGQGQPAAPSDSKPPHPAAPAPPPVAPPEPALGGNDWALTGRLFDLKTLEPVARARMRFVCPERGFQRIAEIDSFGQYVVALPKNVTEGFTILVDAPGYVTSALAEPDVPYAQLSAADRAHLIDSSVDGDAAISRVIESESGRRQTLDVFLAPR